MATNPFTQYGIKEVADVILYDISGASPTPVMYFDTLKISNVEQTAEEAMARGGKGNPKLISWNYGKEINITLQDALVSMKSLELLMGGTVNNYSATTKKIKKAEVVSVAGTTTGTFILKYTPSVTTNVYVIDLAKTATLLTTTQNSYTVSDAALANGQYVRVAYEVTSLTTGGGAYEIVITPERFPGTYMLIGDTIIRNKSTGSDEGFQFIIPKAKINSAATFTLEAEGDPSVIDISLTVLKADNGSMMSLVKYDIGTGSTASSSNLA